MAKKRKIDHSHEVVVEESREPAAYTVGNSGADGQQQQEQQKQQQQQQLQQDYEQQDQQQHGYQQAEGYEGNGYDYADEEQGPPSHYSGPVYPGGSRIDPDTLSYLTEVCEALSAMSDPEEAELLRSNVLEEISGKELQLATDAASASLLEQLLSGAPAGQLMQFMGAFTDGELFWRCAGAAFGSHVTEKVLAWLHAAAKAAAAADGSDIEGLDTLLDALVTGVEPHIVDYATDKHATHVARALLVVVTGRDVLTPPGKKQRQRQQQQQQQGAGGAEGEEGHSGGQQQQQQQKGVFGKQRSSLAEKIEGSGGATSAARYPDLLRRLVKALPLFDPQQMAQLGKNTYGGPLLQAMLRAAAHDEPLLMLLLPPILGLDPSKAAAAAPGQRLATLTDSHVGRLLRDDCYSHLLEVAVAVMPQAATAMSAVADPAAAAGAAAAGGGGDEEGESRKNSKKRKVEGEDEATAAAAAGAGKGLSLADEFYERFLKGRLLPLCCHHCANFVIQAALAATHKPSRVAAYVSELSPHLSDLMRRRRSGVVAALAAAAARGGAGPHQQTLVAALCNALGQQPQWQGRSGSAHLAPALMALDTNAVFGASSGSSGSTTRLSTPGCAMLALLLSQFPPAVVAPFWESMGALTQGDVLRVAKDPSGSRVLEAALAVAPQEASVSKRKLRKLKKKQKTDGGEAAADGGGAGDDAAAVAARAELLSKLKGSWGALVQTPSGSFLLEAVFNTMAPEQAEALVAEVAAVHSQLLSRCSWGNLVSRKLGLEAYMRSPQEWHKRAAAGAAARKEFEQMLSNTGKHGKPAAAAAGVVAQQQQQQQDPAEELGKKGKKKKRSREDAAAAAAAAAGVDDGSADADAAAAEDAAVSNAKKRARLAAAALAAAEAADGEGAAAVGEGGKKERRKKRKLSQADAAAATAATAAEAGSGDAAQPPKKKSKKETQRAAAGADGEPSTKQKKKKRTRDSAENVPAAAADAGGGVNGGAVDLVALLGFGGLSSDKQLSSKKAKK